LADGAITITDKKGRYQLDRLRPNVYSLHAALDDDLAWASDLKFYELKKGERKTDFDVELVKGSLVKGFLI